MEVINEVYPSSEEQMKAMADAGPEGPIYMVNLLKFKEKAQYPDGRDTDLSGREAYMIYGRAVAGILPKFGGRAIFGADVTHLSLGQVEELWDEVAIAMYPKRSAMVDMTSSKEWQEAAVHREAGLEGQLNIETVLADGFSGPLTD